MLHTVDRPAFDIRACIVYLKKKKKVNAEINKYFTDCSSCVVSL